MLETAKRVDHHSFDPREMYVGATGLVVKASLLQEFHRDVDTTIGNKAGVDDSDDVWVLGSLEGLCLLEKVAGIRDSIGWYKLHGTGRAQSSLRGQPHFPEVASAKTLLEIEPDRH